MESELGRRAVQRITLSSSVVIVNALSAWTDENFGMVQGLCIALMIFVISTQLNQNETQSRLIKQVTLLYCNKQIRQLIAIQDISPTSVFSNIMLAIALALMTMTIYDRNKENDAKDLRSILEGLVYLYGDMFDFAFRYGAMKITVFAFGASIVLKTAIKPKTRMQEFVTRLASIVSMNLLSEGTIVLIRSGSRRLAIVECLASLAILRLGFPSMEAYLTYLTANQLTYIAPDIAPILFCVYLWLEPFPNLQWLSETCCIYIILSICNFTSQTPLFWSMILISVLAHYTDFIIQSKCETKKQ